MLPERWHEIEELFGQLVEQPLGERVRFLDRATEGDPELRREVEKLVAADEEAGSYMEWAAARQPMEQAATRPDHEPSDPGLPDMGPYRLLEILGEGGMGTVFLAEQTEPIRRHVALKLVRAGLMREEALLRFRAERQALARMQHPNIAQVFEAGTTEDRQPYFVMEHVPGLPITKYCDRNRLNVRRRLELFMTVCEGVQHLHQKGIIHRDLKPSNILVMEDQGKPIPKIIDFGIAKAIDQPLTDVTLVTGHRLLGTPAYLSPEAIRANEEALDVDTRSDVYALGVLLYELLVGVLPFGARGEGFRRILHRIVEEEATAPSVRLTELSEETRSARAAERAVAGPALRRLLRGDLDWIVLQAMAKRRSERYASAAELATDLRRHLSNEPVLAGPPSVLYRTRKFVRRHATPVAALLLIVLTLVAGLVGRTVEAERANREATRAQGIADFLTELFKEMEPEQARDKDFTVRELLSRGAARLEERLQDQPILRAELFDLVGNAFVDLNLFEQAGSHLERALAIRRGELGDGDLATAESYLSLASLAWHRNDLVEAERLYRACLEIREKVLGTDHLEIAEPLTGLGLVNKEQVRYDEAERIYSRALEIYKKFLGADHPRSVSALNHLAILYFEQGKNNEAESLLRRTIEICQGSLSTDHPAYAKSLHNLAVIVSTQGRYGEAEKLYKQSLEIREKVLPPDHGDVAASISELAFLYTNQKRFSEAESLYIRAIEIKEKTYGPEHPSLAGTLHNFALAKKDQGDYFMAEDYLRRALAIQQKTLAPNHHEFAVSYYNLGEIQLAQERYGEAEKLFFKSREIVEEIYGTDHPGLAYALSGLAKLYGKLGRYTEAKALFQRALTIRENTFGLEHPEIEQTRRDYEELIRSMSLQDEAVKK